MVLWRRLPYRHDVPKNEVLVVANTFDEDHLKKKKKKSATHELRKTESNTFEEEEDYYSSRKKGEKRCFLFIC